MLTLPWYKDVEAALEPSYPLMVALVVLIVLVSVLLVLHGDHVMLAAWLVYLLMP